MAIKSPSSRTGDWRANVNPGFTPNDTGEYAISYTKQTGAKNAPLHVSDLVTTPRFWNWPKWDIDRVHFLSTTALGDYATRISRISACSMMTWMDRFGWHRSMTS